MHRKGVASGLALTLALLLAAFAVGCGNTDQAVDEAGAGEPYGSEEAAASDPAMTVTMNGRSVMGGWMEHWGYSWEGPVEREGFFLDYRELDGGDMASSFTSNVDGLAPGSVVFFKFCFVDFDGSNLEQLKSTVDEVVAASNDRGLKLIIGNALPMHRADSDRSLLTEYEAFNAYLEQVAGQNPGTVWAYDLYGVLAGSDGWLKPSYDVGDSHINEEAYSALDPSFFSLLNTVFGR